MFFFEDKNLVKSINSNIVDVLIQILIFISASPLFDNTGKIVFSLIALFFLILFRKPTLQFSLRNLCIISFLAFVIIFYGFVLDFLYSRSFDFIGVGFLISILIGYFLSGLVTKEEVFLSNERLMFWSVLLGIPLFLVAQYFPIVSDFALTYNSGGFTHKTFFFLNFHTTEQGTLTDRFVGIGREPGVTQIFLLLAIWYRLQRNKKIDFKVAILMLGLFLGKSTAGFFTLLLVLILTIPFKKLVITGILFFPIIIYLITDLWVYHTNNKLAGSVSFLNRYGRYNDFFTGDWLSILGGYGNVYYAQNIGAADLGGWDTLLQVSQRYGFLFFLTLVLILLYNNQKNIIVFLIIVISFFSQLIWFYPIISFFYFKVSNTQSRIKGYKT